MDHPVVKEIQLYGYPSEYREYEPVFSDTLGNEVYPGDEYYDLDGMYFLVEALSWDAVEILELLGAVKRTA